MKKVISYILLAVGIIGMVAVVAGFFSFFLGTARISAGQVGVIGGADGPTAVFVAGKLSSGLSPIIWVSAILLVSIICIAVGIFLLKRENE